MKLYHFTRLVRKYSTPLRVLRPSGGHYEAGDWVGDTAEAREMAGAILPLTARRVLDSGGVLSNLDRQLIMLEPLGRLDGLKVEYQGVQYMVDQDTDYSDFSDVSVYLLKAVKR